jgi:alpha-ketoglutarate-dependent taurine dioxygenase
MPVCQVGHKQPLWVRTSVPEPQITFWTHLRPPNRFLLSRTTTIHRLGKVQSRAWGNRGVMHQANLDYDMSERRYLYRLMPKGEAPA